MHPRLARNPAVIAAVFGVYFALGKLGLAIGISDGHPTALWPPSGLALAAMIVLGRAVWPAVMAGAALVYLTATGQVAVSLTIAIGQTAQALVGAALVDRLAGGADVFKRSNTIFRFVAIVTLLATPISATLEALAWAVVRSQPWADFAYIWMVCWLANLTGALIVTPFITLWTTGPFVRAPWRRIAESHVLLALLTMVCLAVFAGRFPADVQNYPLEFLCVPFLLWAAFRCGRREAATAIVLLSGMAVWGTLRGFGPFVRDSQDEALVLVQAYISVMAVAGLVLAAAVAEHKQAEARLLEAATTDPLTGLANYRHLLDVLRTEIARSNRNKRPFAVVFVDMNGLKKINDQYGHLAGSRALIRVADALRMSCRSIDTPARFGGDEFAIVLPETGAEGGQVVLRRVNDRLAADGSKPLVSVSGGVAVFPRDGESPTLLLRAADKLLYEAKTRRLARQKVDAGHTETARTGTLF